MLSFKTSFLKLIWTLEKDGAVALGLTFHGLRHTVATELRAFSFDTRTIADLLGPKCCAMAMQQSQGVDLQEKLRPGVDRKEGAE